jgi:chemotaxis protein CheD
MSRRPAIPSVERYRVGSTSSRNRAFDDAGRLSRYLHPGQVLIATEPTAITTILGSCVSVCLYDPKRRVGGINHFVLPNFAGRGPSSARFGNVAIETLVDGMLDAGCSRYDLRAMLFGGSHLLRGAEGPTERSMSAELGTRNAEVARSMLASARITILGEDVGGRLGRKLVFFTDDGSFRVKPLDGSQGRARHG